jgi:hypothetical protein
LRRLARQIPVKRIVAFLEKGPRPSVAALGHMVGETGDDKPGSSRHEAMNGAFSVLDKLSP